MSAAVRAVVFDRDGVLLRTDLAGLLRDLMPLLPVEPAELARRWRAFSGSRPLAGADEERLSAAAFLDALSKELDLPEAVRLQIRAFDHGAYVAAFPDAGPALDEARARGLRIGVLTNNTAGLSAEGPLRAAGLEGRVDVALSAQQVGAPKPQREAYLAICKALEARPAECVFFDDVPAWVDGARDAGVRAYRVDRSRAEDDVPGGVLAGLGGLAAALDREVAR